LGSVLFHVGTDGFKSIVQRLSGGSAFCIAIFKFSSRSKQGGWRCGGFSDKDRFKCGDSSEGEEIGLQSHPSTRGASGTTERPTSLKSCAGGQDIFGGGEIKDFSRGEIVCVYNFRQQTAVIV
jgi:hypothetical protein